MQKIFTLILFAVSLFSFNSCTKSNGEAATTYTVNGLHDITVAQGESDELVLDFRNIDGYQEEIVLDVEGLPAGVSVSFSTKSGIPTFTSRIVITNKAAVAGIYDCRLVVNGSLSGKRVFSFTLEVTTQPVCGLVGNYSYTSNCNNIPGAVESIAVSSNSSSIRFGNFGAHGWVVYGDVNCANGTIEVPLQSVGGTLSVGGNGVFSSGGTMTINYTIFTSGNNTGTNCSFTLLRSN